MSEALQSQTVDYLEGLLEGFVAYDENWVMTYINAAGERLLGRRRAEVLGKTWHQAFPHAVGNPVDRMYQRVMRTRRPERMEYEYGHYGGRWFEISASPVRSGGVAVYFRDISDRETLNRIGRTLTAELDLERVVQAVTDAATGVSGAQFGAFFYNRKNEAGESYMLYALSGVPREAFARFPMPRNTAVFEKTFKGEGTLRSDDITKDPRYGKSGPHHGMPPGHLPVRSYLAVPVVSRSGEVHGGLFFGHPETGVFTERAERLVQGIASQAAIAIDNARLYRSLQDSEERFRNVVETQSEMVSRFRADGTLVFVNGAYARALGATPEAIVGRRFWDLVPPSEHAALKAMLDGLSPQRPEARIENRFDTEDGPRWTMWTNRAISFDGEGRLLEVQSTGIDITDRRRAEEALREADRRKDEFLATLSHELRNPLAPIRSAVTLLQHGDADAPLRKRAAEILDRQVRHMVRLVDDLLDVARVSRDTLELRRSPVELAAVVQGAVEAAEPLLAGARQRLQMDLEQAPLVLDADAVRLVQVVTNLLNNASKYGRPGGEIKLQAKREGDAVVIRVRDDGAGIAPERLPRIFELFNKDNRSGGLGIGLSLARRLVEMHGGTISAASAGPGLGAEFTVRIPIVPAGRPAAAAPLPPRRTLSGRRLLVVDDNADAADTLAVLLRRLGTEVRVAHDGPGALAAFERYRPDAVLVDIGMPGMDGYEVARRLRSQPAGRKVPIIAVTGWGQEKDRLLSREAGFDHHLVKPADIEALQSLLASLA
jgi:PAS domain S-box-containing protein